jgi:hypothetical protein
VIDTSSHAVFEARAAAQTIHHSERYRSHVVLLVIRK